MAINQHYNEVLDMLDHLFVYMFNGLKKHCGALTDAVRLSPSIRPQSPHSGHTVLSSVFVLLCYPHVCPERPMEILSRLGPISVAMRR